MSIFDSIKYAIMLLLRGYYCLLEEVNGATHIMLFIVIGVTYVTLEFSKHMFLRILLSLYYIYIYIYIYIRIYTRECVPVQ